LEREVEVPDGLVWHEAYSFVRDTFGFEELARSPAAKIVRVVLVGGPYRFEKASG